MDYLESIQKANNLLKYSFHEASSKCIIDEDQNCWKEGKLKVKVASRIKVNIMKFTLELGPLIRATKKIQKRTLSMLC